MLHLLSHRLREERQRLVKLLSEDAEASQPVPLLSEAEVLDAHLAIADFFHRDEYGMGGVGIKEVNTFVSTVGRQETIRLYGGKSVDDYELIATLLFGIVRNHPFYDANKRTAFLCALLQLHKMGRTITVSEKNFEDFMVEIADRSIEKRAELKNLRQKGEPNPEIKYISSYLRKNSRKSARLRRTLKWRELRSILEVNGFYLSNISKGTIDIVKMESKIVPRFFLGDRVVKKEIRVCTVAYHGEGQDVPDNTLRLIRQRCGLTDQDGFDGEVIMRDAQPTFHLIASYRAALQRLSYR